MKTPKEALKELEYEATNEDSRIGRDEIDADVRIIKAALLSKNEEKAIREQEVRNFTEFFVDTIIAEKLNRDEIIERLKSYHREANV